jgi:hypothetical protein
MTIMYYPNKIEPKGYRVQDKIFDVQCYFPFSKYGQKAKALAEQKQAYLDQKRAIRHSRMNMDINQIFYPDGSVIGLKRRVRRRPSDIVEVFFFQLTINGKQRKTDIVITGRTFHEAYLIIQEKILKLRDAQRCPEITGMFNDCAYLYKRSVL